MIGELNAIILLIALCNLAYCSPRIFSEIPATFASSSVNALSEQTLVWLEVGYLISGILALRSIASGFHIVGYQFYAQQASVTTGLSYGSDVASF